MVGHLSRMRGCLTAACSRTLCCCAYRAHVYLALHSAWPRRGSFGLPPPVPEDGDSPGQSAMLVSPQQQAVFRSPPWLRSVRASWPHTCQEHEMRETSTDTRHSQTHHTDRGDCSLHMLHLALLTRCSVWLMRMAQLWAVQERRTSWIHSQRCVAPPPCLREQLRRR